MSMPTRADGAYVQKPDPRADTKPPGPSLADQLREDYTLIPEQEERYHETQNDTRE